MFSQQFCPKEQVNLTTSLYNPTGMCCNLEFFDFMGSHMEKLVYHFSLSLYIFKKYIFIYFFWVEGPTHFTFKAVVPLFDGWLFGWKLFKIKVSRRKVEPLSLSTSECKYMAISWRQLQGW